MPVNETMEEYFLRMKAENAKRLADNARRLAYMSKPENIARTEEYAKYRNLNINNVSAEPGARLMRHADRERLAVASTKKPIKNRVTAAEKKAEKARLEAEKAKAEEDARLAENAGKLVKQVMRITKKALADGRITKSVKVRVNKCVKKIV